MIKPLRASTFSGGSMSKPLRASTFSGASMIKPLRASTFSGASMSKPLRASTFSGAMCGRDQGRPACRDGVRDVYAIAISSLFFFKLLD
jgi:hypothetical protein